MTRSRVVTPVGPRSALTPPRPAPAVERGVHPARGQRSSVLPRSGAASPGRPPRIADAGSRRPHGAALRQPYSGGGTCPAPVSRGSAGRNGGLGPLTGLGVALMLAAGSVCGALLDVLLVGGPAWALPMIFLTTCWYTAARVRRADWFSALVSPPLAFAAAVVVSAMLVPSAFGPGALGVVATTITLLAAKAKALYLGSALSAGILLARRIKGRRRAA
jgi:hypothetical protein